MFLVNKIVGILPAWARPYAKAIIPAVGAAFTVGATYVSTGTFDPDALKTAGGMAGAALLTFIFPNQK